MYAYLIEILDIAKSPKIANTMNILRISDFQGNPFNDKNNTNNNRKSI